MTDPNADEIQALEKRAESASRLAFFSFLLPILGPFATVEGVRVHRRLKQLGIPSGVAKRAVAVSALPTLWIVSVFTFAIVMVVKTAYTLPTVYVANGSAVRRTIEVDGVGIGGVGSGRARELALPDGRHRICVRGAADPAAICARVVLNADDARVFDPNGESRFVVRTVHYAVTLPPAEPRRPVARAEWYDVRGYDAVFDALPDEVTLDGPASTVTRTAFEWGPSEPVLVVIDNAGALPRRITIDGVPAEVPANSAIFRNLREGEHTLDLGNGEPPIRTRFVDFGAYVIDLEASRAYERCTATGPASSNAEPLVASRVHDASRDASALGEPTPGFLDLERPVRSWLAWSSTHCARPASLNSPETGGP